MEKRLSVPVTYQVTMNVSEEMILANLIAACEGGSNYWVAEVDHYPYDADGNSLRLPAVFSYTDDFGNKSDKTLDRAAIERGLSIMARDYPRHFANGFPSDPDDYNGDATTGDVFLQCCLLGSVIYG